FQPVLFGNRVGALLVTETLIGWEVLPQATRKPMSASAANMAVSAANFDRFRPAMPAPTITTPAKGKLSGSQGDRLSARWRCWKVALGPGPIVVMVSVTEVVPRLAEPEIDDGL